jgi:hypothetical protein
MLGLNSKNLGPERLKSLKAHFVAGWGGYPWLGPRNGSWTNSRSSRKLGSTA